MSLFCIIGGTKRVMARNRSVRGIAPKHILERDDKFCVSSCTNDWVPLGPLGMCIPMKNENLHPDLKPE